MQTYMGFGNLPQVEGLYTNQFVGSVKPTEAEWAEVDARSEKYLPKRAT